MGKVTIVLMLCLMAVTVPMACGIAQEPNAVEEWFQKLPHAKEKVAKLHFYFHDTLSGKNPTSVELARANNASASPIAFGKLFVFDDPLTVGPDPTSKMVGRAQGIYASASMQDLALLMAINFEFTEGKYNGSTLTLLARNPIPHHYREFPIIGGTGLFRLARGIATINTHIFDITTGDAIIEYHAVIAHY